MTLPTEQARDDEARNALDAFRAMKASLKADIIDRISARGGFHDPLHTSNQLDDMLSDCFGKQEQDLERAIDDLVKP